MSNYQFQVLFDRHDRTYQFGEEVSGKVVLDAQAKLTCRNIWIDYGWRTHGKGNRDKGGGKTLTLLSEEVQFQSGEHREYFFRFRAPNGPATYHGHILNVDWYVTANLDIPFRLKIKNERDFLLIASEAPEKIILGDIRVSKDELPITLPADPDIQPGKPPRYPFSSNIIGGLAIILLFLVIFSSNSLFFYALGLLLGLLAAYLLYSYVFPAILRANWKRKFEICDLRVTPSQLYTGDKVTCRLQFQTKSKVYLDNIAAILSAEEVAVSDDGSSSNTYTHVAYIKSLVKSYTENLIAGRLIYFNCVLPVLPDAPVTLSTGHNDIKWSVKVKLSFKRWPSWEKTIPITVLPT
jgi:hypothetical protein